MTVSPVTALQPSFLKTYTTNTPASAPTASTPNTGPESPAPNPVASPQTLIPTRRISPQAVALSVLTAACHLTMHSLLQAAAAAPVNTGSFNTTTRLVTDTTALLPGQHSIGPIFMPDSLDIPLPKEPCLSQMLCFQLRYTPPSPELLGNVPISAVITVACGSNPNTGFENRATFSFPDGGQGIRSVVPYTICTDGVTTNATDIGTAYVTGMPLTAGAPCIPGELTKVTVDSKGELGVIIISSIMYYCQQLLTTINWIPLDNSTTPFPAPNTTPSSGRSDTATIAGAVVGTLAFLFLLALVIRNLRSSQPSTPASEQSDTGTKYIPLQEVAGPGNESET